MKTFIREMKKITWVSRKNLSKQTLFTIASLSILIIMLGTFGLAVKTVISFLL